jgi:radical SAM superfamily enzyme YgiQ (UPF0313 family)
LLHGIRKGESVAQMRAATVLAHDHGLAVKHYYMVGIPGQQWGSVRNTIELIGQLRPEEIYCSIYLPYPHTESWSTAYDQGVTFTFDVDDLDAWEDAYYQSNLDPSECASPIATREMSAREIEAARAAILAAHADVTRRGA